MSPPPGRGRRPLDAAEIAEAAMTAAIVLVLLTVGRLLAAGTFFQVIATVVVAVLAARHRLRVAVTGAFACLALTILLGGIGPLTQAGAAAVFGVAAGIGLRRRMRLVPHLLTSLVIAWPVVVVFTLGFFGIFADVRRLTFETAQGQARGIARLVDGVGLPGAADAIDDAVAWGIDHWWLAVPVAQLGISLVYALIVRRLSRVVLRRVDAALGPAVPLPMVAPSVAGPAPVPVVVGDVLVERGEHRIGVGEVDVTIDAGQRWFVRGVNGRGKTSLLGAIGGLYPSYGIDRDGVAGLGAVGGTAMVGQRPETQVVGARVIDDLRWGLPDLDDPSRYLAMVGLAGRDDQSTGELSGGELQRLALAAALARRPRLLISDESTSMLDPPGRRAVLALLDTAAGDGAAVVHASHLPDEVDRFAHVLDLDRGVAPAPAPTTTGVATRPWRPLLEARGVGYVHQAGSPWARRVLADIDLVVGPGQLALVTGTNGSGKTTLARLLAGLVLPTEGTIALDGVPLTGPSPRIGIAFQHARLQLLRPTVGREVAALAGTQDIDGSLAAVGFDPAAVRSRRVDHLSGGEQRRVLLAGLMARQCEIYILDEPLAGLDPDGRARLAVAVERLLGRGAAVVVVSHEPEWAAHRVDVRLALDATGVGS